MIQTTDWGSCVKDGVATLACIPIVMQNVINFAVLFAGVVCVAIIIYAGIKFATSEGDPEKIAIARRSVTYAIGGLRFVIIFFVVLGIVGNITGVERLVPTR